MALIISIFNSYITLFRRTIHGCEKGKVASFSKNITYLNVKSVLTVQMFQNVDILSIDSCYHFNYLHVELLYNFMVLVLKAIQMSE